MNGNTGIEGRKTNYTYEHIYDKLPDWLGCVIDRKGHRVWKKSLKYAR